MVRATRDITTVLNFDLDELIPSHYQKDFDAILDYFRTALRKNKYLEAIALWRLLKDIEIPKERRLEKSELLIPLIEATESIEWIPTSDGFIYPGKLANLLLIPEFAKGISHYFCLIPSRVELARHIKHLICKEFQRKDIRISSRHGCNIRLDLKDLSQIYEIRRLLYRLLLSDQFLNDKIYNTYTYKDLYYRGVLNEYAIYLNGLPYCCYNWRFGDNWLTHQVI